MKDFLVYLVKSIVDDPESVFIEERFDNGQTIFDLRVNPSDMGRVIGKSGRIIKAVRDLLKIRAIKEEKRVYLNLVEN